MKYLRTYLLLLFGLYYEVLAGKEPALTVSLESIGACKGTPLNYVTFEHFQLWPNRSTTGYIDVLQDIPLTTTIRFRAFEQKDGTWLPNTLSIDNINLCRFVEKDVWFMPTARTVLNLPAQCPVKKGHLVFKATMLFKRSKGLIPIGCIKAEVTMRNKNEVISCYNIVTRMAPYSQRHEHTCIDP